MPGARHSKSDQQHLDQAATHMAQAGVNMPAMSTAPAKSAAKSAEMLDCLLACRRCLDTCQQCASVCCSCPNSLSPTHVAVCAACDACVAACVACQAAADASGLDSPECMAACAACQSACAACAAACIACAVECDHCAWMCIACASDCATCARECGDAMGGAADADMGAEMDDMPMPAMMSANPQALKYVNALHIPAASKSTEYWADMLAVKSVGRDTVRGYLTLWGDPNLVDIENEFFTKSTDFWDSALKDVAKPLTWDHGQDSALKDTAVIGTIEAMGDDDLGRWYVAQLDRNHKYRKAIDALVSKHAVGTSSDSAPQYVIRERTKSGAVWLKQWPIFAAALTTTPAEPRMLDVGSPYWKSTGLAETVARMGSRHSGQSDRLAQLDRELELIELGL